MLKLSKIDAATLRTDCGSRLLEGKIVSKVPLTKTEPAWTDRVGNTPVSTGVTVENIGVLEGWKSVDKLFDTSDSGMLPAVLQEQLGPAVIGGNVRFKDPGTEAAMRSSQYTRRSMGSDGQDA